MTRRKGLSPGVPAPPGSVLGFHTLFAPIDGVSGPDYEPEPIAKIFVTRFETRGPVQALRPFRAEELADNAAIFERFGGGTYELVARREDGTIYAKRMITLEGESKSMNGTPVQTPQIPNGANGTPQAPPPPVLPQTGGTDTMLAYMMQTNMTMMTMLGNVMVAMVSGSKSDAAAQAQAMGETMRATIEAVKPMIVQQTQPPPQQSAMAQVREVLQVAKELQQPPPPVAPAREETTSEIISALGGALGPFMQLAASGAKAAAAVSGGAPGVLQG